MVRLLLIIALLYVALVWLPRHLSRSSNNAVSKPKKDSGQPTVTRTAEPKKKVLDPSDITDAQFEEVEEQDGAAH